MWLKLARVAATAAAAFALIGSTAIGAPSKTRRPPNAAATSAKSPVTRAPLAIFDFQGEDTEHDYSRVEGNPIPRGACRVNIQEAVDDYNFSCRNQTWLADITIWPLIKQFYKGKLFYVNGTFSKSDYDDMLQLFTDKYGPPAGRGTKTVQNVMGATFEDEVTYWRFRGGVLSLESIADKIDQSTFTFVSSDNAPPKPTRKVDF